MTAREFGSVAIAVFALKCIVDGIVHLLGALPFIDHFRDGTTLLSTVSFGLGQVMIGGLLFILRNRLVAFTLRTSQAPQLKLGQGAQQLECLAFALFGLWLLVSAIIQFTEVEVVAILKRSAPNFEHIASSQDYADLWAQRTGSVLQAIFGIILLLHTSGVIRLWHRLRTAGHPIPQTAAQQADDAAD